MISATITWMPLRSRFVTRCLASGGLTACLLLLACASPSAPPSVLHVADPKAAAQLLEGWHEVEGGSWRWTRRHFSVSMNVPAPGRRATLRLRFSIPPPHIERLGSLTLSAAVNGSGLPASSYNSPGDQLYSAPIPASALQGPTARIEFELDKAAPPTASDVRELGIIVSAVSLE